MPHLKGQEIGGYVEIDRKIRFQKAVQFDQDNPIGDVFYVRDTGSTAYVGTKPDKPFPSITYALTKAGDWDVIRVLPNATYTTVGTGRFLVEAATPVTITQRGLKLLGMNSTYRGWGNPMVRCTSGAGGASLINVNADDVEIAYLGFYPNTAASKGINLAYSQAIYGGHVHDCYFKGGDVAVAAITTGAASYDAVGVHIERCYFQQFLTSCIEWYAGMGSAIENCTFVVPNAKNGINSLQQGGGKGWSFILNNKFLAQGTASQGILRTETPSDYYQMVDGNEFCGFADEAHCFVYDAQMTGRNYLDGVLVDS